MFVLTSGTDWSLQRQCLLVCVGPYLDLPHAVNHGRHARAGGVLPGSGIGHGRGGNARAARGGGAPGGVRGSEAPPPSPNPARSATGG